MRLKAVISAILVAIGALALGQPMQWTSYDSIPGPGADQPSSLANCPEGGYYVLTSGALSSRLARYTSTGVLMWEIPVPGSPYFQLGPTFNDGRSSQDPMTPIQGGVLLTMHSVLSAWNTSFSLKVDNAGHILSNHTWPGVTTVYVDSVGNQYAATNNITNSVFEKLDPNNNLVWQKAMRSGYEVMWGIIDPQAVSVEGMNVGASPYVTRFSLDGVFQNSSASADDIGLDDASGNINLGERSYGSNGWYALLPKITGNPPAYPGWFATFGNTIWFTSWDGSSIGSYTPATYSGKSHLIPGITPGSAKSLTVDSSGNITVGAALKEQTKTQALITQLGSSGALIWQSLLGGNVDGADSYAYRLVNAPDQSVVALSQIDNLPDTPTDIALTNHDPSNGHVLWRTDIRHSHASNAAVASATDAQGNTYVLGVQFWSLIPVINQSFLGQAVVLEKINPLGITLWNKVVATGSFLGAIDLNSTSDGCELIYAKYPTIEGAKIPGGQIFVGGQIYVAKYLSDGSVAWSQKAMNNPGYWMHAFGRSGTVYLAGTATSGSPTALGVMTNSGQLTWGQPTVPEPDPTALAVDHNGNAYLTASQFSTVGGTLYKLNSSGNVIWQRQLTQSTVSDYPYIVQLGPNDQPFVLSRISDSSGTDTDNWALRRFDTDGNLVYKYTRDDSAPVAFAIDQDGDAYLQTVVDSHQSLIPNDQIVSKLTPQGTLEWNRAYSLSDVDGKAFKSTPRKYQLMTDGADSVYMTARTEGGLAFDCNYAVVKYTSDGDFGWPSSGGSFLNGVFNYDSHHLDDSVANLAMDSIGNFYLAGTSTGPSYDYELNVLKFGPVSSTVANQSMPSTLNTGGQANVSVTFTNNGTTTWTAADGYNLFCLEGSLWNSQTISFANGDSIAPGQSKTFSFSIKAPSSPGTYACGWCLTKNGVPFGRRTASQSVIVSSLQSDAAQYVSEQFPTTISVGSSFTATVTMKDTGTTTWTQSAGYCLISQNPVNNMVWGTNRLLIPASASVAPGQSVVCFNTVTAPAAPGSYGIRWQMYKNGSVFGDVTASAFITVVANPDSAQFLSQKSLTTVAAGATFSATVTMKNNGTSTWTQAGGYCLLSQNPSNNKVWGTNRLLIPSASSVVGGASVVCSNTLVAPSTPGTYTMQWRMYHNGILFGDATVSQSIVVTAH